MGQALKEKQLRSGGTSYARDLYTWAFEQAALLKSGHLGEIDAANIAEELEDVGHEQYDKLESALAVLLMHILKWDHQPERRSRSWTSTISEQRRRAARVLKRNPGLKSRLGEAVGDGYLDGRDRAAAEMDVAVESLPASCPYPWDDIQDRAFVYEPLAERGR